MPPVSHQLTCDREHGSDLDTSSPHPCVGVIRGAFAVGAGSFGVGIDGISFLDEGECKESSANLHGETSENHAEQY